jgi:hypothetical protein
MSTPPTDSNRSDSNKPGCLPILGLLVSILYLANLSAGVIELPDNLPLIGNLDEVFFSAILFASLARLGIRIPLLTDRFVKLPPPDKREAEDRS